MRVLTAGLLAASVATGCGETSDRVGQADVQAYAELSQQISSAASSYGTAANATTDVPGCESGHTTYDGLVRPMVERMRSTSGDMDREMGMMGHAADADMACGADAMAAELDHHDAVACTSTAMSANHDEATRHASDMETWADHQHARADEMGGMMGMTGMGGGATTTCHRNGDGTFTLQP